MGLMCTPTERGKEGMAGEGGHARVYQKANGFVGYYERGFDEGMEEKKELVIEGKDPKKIGQMVLDLFAKRRGPKAKKGEEKA
jgi:hypothetical protein